MRRVLTFTIAAAAVVALAWWLAGLPGHVEITLSGTTIRFATSIAVVALAAVVGAL